MTTFTPDPAIRKKLAKARALLLIEQPFYGVLSLKLQLEARNSLPTLAVDGETIFYNEKFINELPMDQLRTAVAHEVGHCVFQHIARRGARDKAKWNLAGDHVINLILEEAGFSPIPGYWNADPQFKGMTAEQVYNKLPDPDPNGGGSNGQQPLCDIMNGPSSGGDDSSGDQPMDEAKRAELEADWTVATVQAANAAKQQGKLPGSLERFVEALTEPKVDWREQLRRFVTETARDDYSYRRLNRKMLAHDYILPGMFSERMGTVVVVSDDSGSIDNKTLAAFEAEIKDIRASAMPQKTVHISCDAAINHVAEFTMEEPFKIVSKGGGGTDFRPPFDWVEKQGITPAAFIYLTDLYGPAPDVPPDYPVMWVCTTKGKEGPWGETIHIDV